MIAQKGEDELVDVSLEFLAKATVTFFSVVGLTTGLFQILALTERARSRDRALRSQREAAAVEARRQARALSLLRDVSEAGVAHQVSGALAR